MAKEITALRLGTIHNIHFLLSLMREMRAAIAAGRFAELRTAFLARYRPSNQEVRHEQRQLRELRRQAALTGHS
jgi:queuine tRNA-ribosyltransferase